MKQKTLIFGDMQHNFRKRISLASFLPRDPTRALALAAATYLLLSLLATYYFIAYYPTRITANLLFDDAYYYLGVAQSIAQGKGSSFGELVNTNGYQPLWLILLAASIYVVAFQKMWVFGAMLTTMYLIKSFSLFQISTLKSVKSTPLLLAAAVAVLQYPGIFSQGLETCLLLLCLPLLGQLKQFPESFSIKTCLKYSAIFIFLFLIRLDLLSVLAAFSLLSMSSIIKGKRGIAKNLAITILITLAAVSIYFVINYTMFGTIVPISGLNKAVGNKIGENYPLLFKYLVASRFAIIVLALDLILMKKAKGTAIDTNLFSTELKLIAIATPIVAIYYAFFSGWPLWNWYYWPIALFEIYAMAKLFYLSVMMRKNYQRNSFVNAAIYFSWFFLAYIAFLGIKTEFNSNVFRTMVGYHVKKKENAPPENWTAMNLKVINDFFSRVPPGIVAMGDRAGGLGFWLPERFKFFQTEGLVANKDYLLARKNGTALDFLKNLGIKYFVVERERIFEGSLKDGTQMHGIVEPIQGMSAHSGFAFICLPADSVLYAYYYEYQYRYIYDFTKVTECPAEMKTKMVSLTNQYGALRKYSLPSEYLDPGFLKQYILNPN
jgi:hypothetical protein